MSLYITWYLIWLFVFLRPSSDHEKNPENLRLIFLNTPSMSLKKSNLTSLSESKRVFQSVFQYDERGFEWSLSIWLKCDFSCQHKNIPLRNRVIFGNLPKSSVNICHLRKISSDDRKSSEGCVITGEQSDMVSVGLLIVWSLFLQNVVQRNWP